jgi:hypothetical protein
MRQLHNQHPIDTKPGQIGITVRRGGKWADVKPGEELELCVGVGPNDQVPVGRCIVKEAVLCQFINIPARLIELEHEQSSRVYTGLLASMRKAYGADFNEQEPVVVLAYGRTE